MKTYKKSHILLKTLVLFALALILTDKGGMDSSLRYDFSLNSGAVISYINANSNTNSFSQDKDKSTNNFELLINESRISFYSEDNLFDANNNDFYAKNHSKLLIAYIQSYSIDRVLHPPLEQLGSLLI